MRLTAWEEERVQIFAAAELARRRRSRGLRLNSPEAIALICDAMLEAARDGGTYERVAAAGVAAVAPGDVLDGVRELVDEVRLEVLLADGTRLVVLSDPLGRGAAFDARGPGAIVARRADHAVAGSAATAASRERRRLRVRNTSRRVVRVSSHMPFADVNGRLVFDRPRAVGFRLDLPAGASLRWAPGEEKEVTLVAYGGELGAATVEQPT